MSVVSAIAQEQLRPQIGPSSDPDYVGEATGVAGCRFRFGLAPSGALQVGMQLRTGERIGFRFDGFNPTQRTFVGSAASFRVGGRTMTFRVVDGQLKERIRWNAITDASARWTIPLLSRDCHFEGGVLGGLVVWSNVGNGVVATISAPTIVDSNGRSDCPVSYELAPDGSSVDLVVDAAWLTAAAFPVFIDPTTTITSTAIDATALSFPSGQHVFKLNDGSLVALWIDTSGNLKRARSTDAGSTWPTITTPFTGVAHVAAGSQTQGLAATHDVANDAIYGIYSVGASNTKFGKVFKMAWSGSAWTDTNADTNYDSGSSFAGWGTACAAWDTVHSRLIVFYGRPNGITALAEAYSSTLGYVAAAVTSGMTNIRMAMAIDQSSPNICYFIGFNSGTFPYYYVERWTFNGSAFTNVTTFEAWQTDTQAQYQIFPDCFIDASGQLEIVYTDYSSSPTNAVKHVKRTGSNTWSAVTTLRSGNPGPDVGFAGSNVVVVAVGNANADCMVFWRDNQSQANGEIWSVKRTAGVWGSAALFVGGSATGWSSPSVIDKVYGDLVAYLLYNSPIGSLVFNSSGNVAPPPLAPTNPLPTGSANPSLTPTCSATYNIDSTTDALSKYRVLVTRVSDSVVMWDSGSSGTAWGGAQILAGGTFSIAYGGSALAKDVVYQIQFSFWEQVGGQGGPLSTAVTFKIEDAPVVTITSTAAPKSSGPTVTWTYSQTLNHAQASYRVVIKDAGDVTTIYDSGALSGAATSVVVPSGTLKNNTTYQLHVTATSSDGL